MSISWRRSLRLLLLFATTFPLGTVASPPINVNLEAAFSSAPFIIELLETAAEEKPDVYFPLLDRVAEGRFDSATSDEELYNTFLDVLKDDQLITNAQALSSFKFALSIRNSAPRIEAHYHYYNTTILPALESTSCEAWIEREGKQYCDPRSDKEDSVLLNQQVGQALPFDRALGSENGSIQTLYADLASTDFRKFHKIASKEARDGKSIYRVRYKPSGLSNSKPLVVSGYGVELALKRTDYIVIDDRNQDDAKEAQETVTKSGTDLIDDEEVSDLKPLTAYEVAGLAMKAAEFVARSEHPMETLLKVTQDFPKHSNAIAQRNSSVPFREEFFHNRETFLPSGFNAMWINGAQYDPRKVDAFSLLDHMRRERKLVGYFQETGLSAGEAVALMSHPAVMESFTKQQGVRYDWRDTQDGGDVIMWFNDIEKDKRYKEWPSDLDTLLQRLFPGQMPTIRKDMFNCIVPIDFSKPESIKTITDTILALIKRKIPIRWGIVPLISSKDAEDQARMMYYLLDTYGLVAVMDYLEKIADSKLKSVSPLEGVLKIVLEKRTPKMDKTEIPFEDLSKDESLQTRLENAKTYVRRLGAAQEEPPFFINGVAGKLDDDWLNGVSSQISADLRTLQRGVFEGLYGDDLWLPEVFLNGSSLRRSPFIMPEDEKSVSLVSLYGVFDPEVLEKLPQVLPEKRIAPGDTTQLFVIADFDSDKGLGLALSALQFRKVSENVHVVLAHNPTQSSKPAKSNKLLALGQNANEDLDAFIVRLEQLISGEADIQVDAKTAWPETSFLKPLRLQAGDNALVMDSRKLGPIPAEISLTVEDLEILHGYEEKRRLRPARTALSELRLDKKLKDSTDTAILFSLLAMSSISEIPEGIFETPPPVRTDIFYEWKEELTTISVGDNSTAVIQFVVSLDPASETAQRWVPILKVLSELDGVYLRIYLNPKELQEELPVKRFYRYVLGSEPKFDNNGYLEGGAAQFKGIPDKALLTLGMDVPAAWVVSSKVSVQDLDNIKLSSLPAGGKVEATYELEYILIEGHSREGTTTNPPAGVQLVLSTAENPRVADTIIMANLGYFQFKANPGHYNITLKPGRSEEVYDIQSVGALGYEPQPGDESTEISLLSFQGVTVYPRLFRKPGKEEEDVLEPSSSKSPDLVNQAAKLAGSLLSKAGLAKEKAPESVKHADINIFSVASGHLYERMLNIMMVSVMRHTNHTVKFWFIEQFLSPSFKAFLPTMAETYGFQYEMVTYKWPHWLRGQKEKQREIWGYKILFLDVLFPLDLDKVIFVDADQIVRTDMQELNDVDLEGAPYGFTPMCDSRTEMEGFRFWKQGYWKNFLKGLPYHISALYVVDLKRFRQLAAGDRLRQQYHTLSADPHSLSNLDQDLPNNMQAMIPIKSLDQNWLWCETWCSDEALKNAKTIDLCNNPQTKEPKLERARRQVPEWTEYDDEIAEVARRTKQGMEIPVGSVQEDELAGKTMEIEKDEATSTLDAEPSKKTHDEL